MKEYLLHKESGHPKYTVALHFKEAGAELESHESEIFAVVSIHDEQVARDLKEATQIGGGNGLQVFLDHFERQEILRLLDYE